MLSLEELVNEKALRTFFSTASLEETHVQALIAYVTGEIGHRGVVGRHSSDQAIELLR
jgi:hypothetical protein